MSENRLTRSNQDTVIAGICGGIAEYLDTDPVLVRALFVLLFFASGIGLVIYLILWFIMPKEDAVETGTAVLKENLDDIGHTVSDKAKHLSQPGAVGIGLIALGVFFLLNQLGWFGWLGSLFWPLAIISIGIYLLALKNR